MIRIVKMTFRPEAVNDFLNIFESSKYNIRQRPGCKSLKLVQDLERPNIFFTISEWEDPACLEQYRNSELFKEVWAATKRLFAEKAEAWSVNVCTSL